MSFKRRSGEVERRGRGNSGWRARLACWFRRPAETNFDDVSPVKT